MPCYHPIPAWRSRNGQIQLHKEIPDGIPLQLPCGGCIGCNTMKARSWSLRNHLEMQRHSAAAFTTLTYSADHLPVTLSKRHVQLFLKRLRKNVDAKIRFFACGEYGEKNGRPHYHALLYGLDNANYGNIDRSWQMGQTKTVALTPAAINYVTGYCAKKIGDRSRAHYEQVDPETGEVYQWQPPFTQMSRRPGIGAHARQWTDSWRSYAVYNGVKVKVPRYYHEAWKQIATEEEIEELAWEKSQLLRDTGNKDRLAAGEQIAISRQAIKADRRKL